MREIAERNLTGSLRLTQASTTRHIFFDDGAPIFAASNLAAEQIDYLLLKENRTTAGLIEHARATVRDGYDLSRVLVETGLVTQEVISQSQSDLSLQIIFSAAECIDGEYHFEALADLTHPKVVTMSAADCILECIRRACHNECVLDAKVPRHHVVTQIEMSCTNFASSANLSSTESYVLSRVDEGTPVSDVGNLTGLPDDEGRRALCALASLGLIGIGSSASRSVAPPAQRDADPLLEGISRKLKTFESSDYYQILGVTKLSPISQIHEAFRALEVMFSSYRLEHPDNHELQTKLNQLFERIREAHQTLSDPQRRWAYDRPTAPLKPASFNPSMAIRANPGPDLQIERGQTPAAEPASIPKAPRRTPLPEPTFSLSASSGFERGQALSPGGNGNTSYARSSGVPAGSSGGEFQVSQSPGAGTLSTAQAALHYYRQGRVKYEQHDLHAAEHLLREACKLDPQQPHYHYHLGVTLMILSQARHAHAHHEGCHVTCKIGGTLVSNPRVRYEAERHFLKALELDPANTQIMIRLGVLYKEARLYKKADHFFRETLVLDGKNQVALRELQALENEIVLDDRSVQESM